MAIWGVGAKFDGWDNKLYSFVNESFWCTGFTQQEKPEIYEMIKNIQIGDIVYVKSLPIKSNIMNVRAVGIVTESFKNFNSHNGFGNCGNEIGVKWLIAESNQPLLKEEITDKYINGRKTTIFKEYNKDIIKRVINLLNISEVKYGQ